VRAIWGEKWIPGLLDRFLARTGYKAQQTDEPADQAAPSNLWKPVPGDAGAHGRFDARARDYSVQVWMNQNRSWLVPACGAALLAAAGGVLLKHLGGLRRRRFAWLSAPRSGR
jgi:hypothetical protein